MVRSQTDQIAFLRIKEVLWKKDWDTFVLAQVVFISSIKPISTFGWRCSRENNLRGQGKGLQKIRGQGHKYRLFEDRPSQGQGQEWSRPRPKTEHPSFINYGRQIFDNF